MKKKLYIMVFFIIFIFPLWAGFSFDVKTENALEVLKNDTIQELISDVESKVKKDIPVVEKKELYILLALAQEQLGMFPEARIAWNKAASFSDNTKKTQEYLLSAVRCALSCGDIASADFLLSTQFENPATNEIHAHIKLYALWSWISKTEDKNEIASVVPVLESYAQAEDMKAVKPIVLFTLSQLSSNDSWKESLLTEFPQSPEAAVLRGEAELLPSPFWFFTAAKAGTIFQ